VANIKAKMHVRTDHVNRNKNEKSLKFITVTG